MATEELDKFEKALFELQHSHRRVFVLRRFEDWPTAEIARDLGVGERSARNYISRAAVYRAHRQRQRGPARGHLRRLRRRFDWNVSYSHPTATCADFTRRRGTGQVINAHETSINAGFNHLRLVQHRLRYEGDLARLPWLERFADPGTIDIEADVLDMRENDASVSGKGFDLIEYAGTIGVPRWSFVSDIGYGWRGWSLHWLTLYSSRSYFNLTYTVANQLPLSIPSSTIHDLDVLYRFDRRFRLALHIDNVFDKAPPQPWVYGADVLGRMFELSFRAQLE